MDQNFELAAYLRDELKKSTWYFLYNRAAAVTLRACTFNIIYEAELYGRIYQRTYIYIEHIIHLYSI